MKFQSPKSEKFESNDIMDASILNNQMFQSPRSGKFESNNNILRTESSLSS